MRASFRTTAGLLAAAALLSAALPAVARADSDDDSASQATAGRTGRADSPSKTGTPYPLGLTGLADNANVGVTSVSDRD
ncbi:hypothetical protein [Streptomyces sp. NPDC007100]|uniref:hypothetical protein n=1 Tax=unclassified Streptomyces TaxID=2593676 RepID=UPI00340F2499